MNIDGSPRPDIVVIRIPSKVLVDLENQYERLGYSTEEGTQAALSHMYKTVQKYLAAGTGYVIIDESGKKYQVPFGDEFWCL